MTSTTVLSCTSGGGIIASVAVDVEIDDDDDDDDFDCAFDDVDADADAGVEEEVLFEVRNRLAAWRACDCSCGVRSGDRTSAKPLSCNAETSARDVLCEGHKTCDDDDDDDIDDVLFPVVLVSPLLVLWMLLLLLLLLSVLLLLLLVVVRPISMMRGTSTSTSTACRLLVGVVVGCCCCCRSAIVSVDDLYVNDKQASIWKRNTVTLSDSTYEYVAHKYINKGLFLNF